MASQYRFGLCGNSGMELSELILHLDSVADATCLVRSIPSDAFTHHPNQLLPFTGSTLPGRPTLGSWLLYGLGSESKNPPGATNVIQQETIDFVDEMNRFRYAKTANEEIASRINAHELAFRMHREAPPVLSLGRNTVTATAT